MVGCHTFSKILNSGFSLSLVFLCQVTTSLLKYVFGWVETHVIGLFLFQGPGTWLRLKTKLTDWIG